MNYSNYECTSLRYLNLNLDKVGDDCDQDECYIQEEGFKHTKNVTSEKEGEVIKNENIHGDHEHHQYHHGEDFKGKQKSINSLYDRKCPVFCFYPRYLLVKIVFNSLLQHNFGQMVDNNERVWDNTNDCVLSHSFMEDEK